MDWTIRRKDRREYFPEAAERMGVLREVVEKDYWVCWMLNRIFSGPFADKLTFKGGTSLSKVYRIIERFSEDIDLTIDKAVLGIDPAESLEEEGIGSKQKKKRRDAFETHVQEFLHSKIFPWLEQQLKFHLHDEKYELLPDPDDPQALNFIYPETFDDGGHAYIPPRIKLEFGAKGESSPQERRQVTAYIYEHLPQINDGDAAFEVAVLLKDRTFWEKVTLLHSIAHRPADKALPPRMSRHYYDVHRMAEDRAFIDAVSEDMDLLAAVVKNKRQYFYESWDWYDNAKPGTLKIVPEAQRLKAIGEDYAAMRDMFFREPPAFNDLVTALQDLETALNKKK